MKFLQCSAAISAALEMEVVSCRIAGGNTTLTFPVAMLILPSGSSPIRN